MDTPSSSVVSGVSAAASPRVLVRSVLREEALRAGLSPNALTGRLRSRVAVAARTAAIARVAALYPQASSVVLGRMFGRHHTTILHALGRTARARNAHRRPREA
ncbi:MAG: hypothetical protein JNK07_10800 [Alphaproteobacteria bacterium]|nr:hypothetical protein [Alphaproteobacteria bacterium]